MDLEYFVNTRIRYTKKSAILKDTTVGLCRLSNFLALLLGIGILPISISTRALKHLYDKRPAEEFDFLVRNLLLLVKFPDQIYNNKEGKRGGICLVKQLDGLKYICVIEDLDNAMEVVTCFRLRKEGYLQGYKLIWSRKDDIPSS